MLGQGAAPRRVPKFPHDLEWGLVSHLGERPNGVLPAFALAILVTKVELRSDNEDGSQEDRAPDDPSRLHGMSLVPAGFLRNVPT